MAEERVEEGGDRILEILSRRLQFLRPDWAGGDRFGHNEASKETLESPPAPPPQAEVPEEPVNNLASYEGTEQSDRAREILEAARSAIENRRLEQANTNDEIRVV